MANSIITREQLEVFAEQINESCPVLEDARSTQTGLKGRDGKKIKVAIPDPGTTVVKNGGIPVIGTDVNLTDIAEFEKEFEVAVATNVVALDSLEAVVDVDSFEKEISGPRCASVGAGVEEDVIGKSYTVADSAYVTAVGNSFDGFGVLADMAGDLDDSRVKGDLVGYMSGMIKAKIAKSGSEKFNAEGIVGDLYRQSKIGEYANVAWKKTAMPIVEVTAAAPSAITAVSQANGTITVTTASGASYPKGYAFKISGIYKKDVLGKNTGIEKVFILQEAVTATGTSAVLKVGEFSATGAHANVSELPAAGDTIVGMLSNNKKYAVVWAFAKGNLEFSPVKLSAAGLDEVSASAANGKVTMSAVLDGSASNRQGIYRFDAAYIAGAVDSRRAVVGYIQLN